MKSHVIMAILNLAQVIVCAPTPRPIEDIYPSQIPDAGAAPIVAGDSGILPTLLAVGFDPNDTSALSGGSKKQ